MKNGKRWVGNTVFTDELPDSSVLLKEEDQMTTPSRL
jgi:hypothetical protein